MTLAINPCHPEEDDEPTCAKCGAELEWTDCDECDGEGLLDLYDEDPVNFAEGVEFDTCELCGGHGGWLECRECISRASSGIGK